MTQLILTPSELRDTLARILAGAAGGTIGTWHAAIGEVEKLPTHSNVRSNWRISPTGTAAELATIDQAVAIVREAHPYVAL